MLVSVGASLDSKDKDLMTAMIWAAKRGHTEIAKLLIAAGASLNIQDEKQKTALIWAAE